MHNAGWAFKEYEKIRSRLPNAAYPKHSKTIQALHDIANDFDVFLFDAFGVLNVGNHVIPSALACVAALQKIGKRTIVLTNSASQPATAMQTKFKRFGFEFAPNDIVSSRDALCSHLTHDKQHWAAMANVSTRVDLLPAKTLLLGHDSTVHKMAEGFLLLSSAEWDAAKQSLLLHSLCHNPRPVLCANPDITAPRENGFSLQPGHYANQLAEIPGVTVEYFGKPFANIFDQAFAGLGTTDKSRVLMVGDTLHTDIIGGAAYGLKTALVTDHGLFQGLDTAPFIAASGIHPDYILPAI